MRYWFLSVLIICTSFQQYLTSQDPTRNDADQEAYDEVKELESLRNENSKHNNTESGPQDSGKAQQAVQPTATPNTDESEPQPNSRSAIFRHRGITQAKKNKYWNTQLNDDYPELHGIQYSPADLARYVIATGDEESVAMAVEELVGEGLLGRTDAINYLQDLKKILKSMKEQNEQLKKTEEFKFPAYPKMQGPLMRMRLPNPSREHFLSQMVNDKRESKAIESPPAPIVTTEHPHQVVIASTSEPKGPTHSASTTMRPKTEASPVESFKDDDFKRRAKEKEARNSFDFTLEVIYKLAKDMFSQSILRDDPTAENTLSGLVSFLENEVGNKRISPEIKEKVLEVVLAALVASLHEYQSMFPENQALPFDESGLYRHLAEQNGPSSNKGIPEVYRKLAAGHENSMLQLASKSNRPKSS